MIRPQTAGEVPTRVDAQFGQMPKLTLIKPDEQKLLDNWWNQQRTVFMHALGELAQKIDELKAQLKKG